MKKNNDLWLSVSKTKSYLDCQRKFKFAYIDKLPRKIWKHHTFGTFCHQVLENFHNAYIKGSKQPYNVEMTQAFKDSWKIYKKDMDDEMKKEAWEISNNYLKLISNKKLPNVIACEQKFKLNVINNNSISSG